MTLKEYKTKRNLKKSHEPLSKGKSQSDALNFCVQKHAARRLHYDFRLEYRGVLLSWAVPKGPSLNPEDKRLAIKVEDHPLDYQYFEGTIPKGNYGAGTVELWDRGHYKVPHGTTRQEIEASLEKGLKQGHFAIILEGEKLQGEFIFQKLKSDQDDHSWLLIKKEDSHSQSSNKEDENNSHEHSGKHIDEHKVKLLKMPAFISPMLCTLIEHPFTSDDWLFEVKWDGYRALAFIKPKEVRLISRTKHLLNDKFSSIVDSLKKIKNEVVLDGEVVVVDSSGRSSFQLIQNYQKEKKGILCYYVFDLLYKDGKDLRMIPLIERKEKLKELLKELSHPLIRYSDHVMSDGEGLFKEALKKHLEGIVGKKIFSPYESKRSQDWVKIKTLLRQEVVIGGFTAPQGSRTQFGALLVGVYNEENELIYVGHVGGGFNTALLHDIYQKLNPLIQKSPPFKIEPKANAAVTWVKPRLVCEVSFAEWTKDNIMRQPIFHGLRIDKNPKTVKKEDPIELPLDRTNHNKKEQKISLTHVDKIYWPQEKYTKGDLIDYYTNMAPIILPYLKDRPIMLHRFPEGIEGTHFYQKNIEFQNVAWIKTFPVKHEGKIDHYLLINDLKSLLFAVNLGSIDLHPFMTRCKDLNHPDYCVIDFDPQEIPFEKAVEAILVAHEILEEIEIKHYCKTSGGRGLHLFIPFHGKYDFEQSRQFAEIISLCIHKKLPLTTSLERNPKTRKKKIYLDCLQNRFGQTIVAPYAVRPRPKACVSTPLTWDEVNEKLDPTQFNIKTIFSHLKEKGDVFKPILGAGINLNTALAKLKKSFKIDL